MRRDWNATQQVVSLEDWLSERSPVHLSTNSGTPLAAFQTWRNFKEAFAPELVAQAVEETSAALGRQVRTSIDPFGGSGTTALASQFLGIHPTTIEVNPYLADLIEAKVATYDVDQLISDFTHMMRMRIKRAETALPGSPATFVEPGVKGKYLFAGDYASELTILRSKIDRVENNKSQRLFRVLLASIATELCNAVVSGKGRRYRRGWESKDVDPSRVKGMFTAYFEHAVYDIARYKNRKQMGYRIIRGDARKHIPMRKEFDVAVFSPPYPNSFDYTDVYNVELWVGGYLQGKEDNRNLRMETLRSHVQLKRSYEVGDLQSSTLERVFDELSAVRASLWNKDLPEMVQAYFDDMNTIMQRLFKSLVKSGRAYIVVGDSQYQAIRIPVGDILIELGSQIGYKYLYSEPFRSMRASPQQGGREELLETLIVLER